MFEGLLDDEAGPLRATHVVRTSSTAFAGEMSHTARGAARGLLFGHEAGGHG